MTTVVDTVKKSVYKRFRRSLPPERVGKRPSSIDKEMAKLRKEREKRIIDAIELRIPDRVPVLIPLGYFPAHFAGVPTRNAYYDLPAWKEAYLKSALYLQPDRFGVVYHQGGKVLETLEAKAVRWPGHGVSSSQTHEFVEGEYMKADEYDMFISRTADYVLRFILPRSYGSLSALGDLPSVEGLLFGLPLGDLGNDGTKMLENLAKASKEAVSWQRHESALFRDLNDLGFPECRPMFEAHAPFDTLVDALRGKGAMSDMNRRPEKVVMTLELLSRVQHERIDDLPQAKELSFAFIGLHHGSDASMTPGQFQRFYWPYVKTLVEALAQKGYTPEILFEGDYVNRLEFLRELPAGRVIAMFDKTNMARVKEILGGHLCVAGNVPASVLESGKVEDVTKHCRWLIDMAGRDGGYIMAPGGSIDGARPENLKAMVDFTKEYGVYR